MGLTVSDMMPDDDNALTVTKGSNATLTSFIRKSATAGRADVDYGMNGKKFGTLKNLLADLEATQVDADESGASFAACMDTDAVQYLGRVYLKRGL